MNKSELLQIRGENMDANKCALIIDFHPSSKERIGLIEIENIHLYTYGNSEMVYWSPMMLELYNLFYEEEYVNLTAEEKSLILSNIECPGEKGKILEFLYVNGDNRQWNWGRNGMTNAAFLDAQAVKYSRQFFI